MISLCEGTFLLGSAVSNDLEKIDSCFLYLLLAMQIQYNITRIEEWCKSHDIPEGTLQLEHLMQATKLLQFKKASLEDIENIYDVCWILSPTQIQKLISQYQTADYEVTKQSFSVPPVNVFLYLLFYYRILYGQISSRLLRHMLIAETKAMFCCWILYRSMTHLIRLRYLLLVRRKFRDTYLLGYSIHCN